MKWAWPVPSEVRKWRHEEGDWLAGGHLLRDGTAGTHCFSYADRLTGLSVSFFCFSWPLWVFSLDANDLIENRERE